MLHQTRWLDFYLIKRNKHHNDDNDKQSGVMTMKRWRACIYYNMDSRASNLSFEGDAYGGMWDDGRQHSSLFIWTWWAWVFQWPQRVMSMLISNLAFNKELCWCTCYYCQSLAVLRFTIKRCCFVFNKGKCRAPSSLWITLNIKFIVSDWFFIHAAARRSLEWSCQSIKLTFTGARVFILLDSPLLLHPHIHHQCRYPH